MMAEEEGEYESVIAALEERLERHDNSRREVQESLHSACDELRKQIDEMEEGVNSILEEEFTKEDNRLQSTLAELRKCMSKEGISSVKLSRALDNAMTELLMIQTYGLVERNPRENAEIPKRFELKTEKQFTLRWTHMRKPTVINGKEVSQGYVQLKVTGGIPNEEIIERNGIPDPFSYKAFIYREGNEEDGKEYPLTRKKRNKKKILFTFKPEILEPEAAYRVRMKTLYIDKESEWSDEAEFTTPKFYELCTWKECSDDVDEKNKYSVDEKNPRIAIKIGGSDSYCTIIGNSTLPFNKVTSWNVKVLKSKDSDGKNMFIGVAPLDIDQRRGQNYDNCGWYFGCYSSALWSGPPQGYKWKEYGPRKGYGDYVHTGDSIGLVMDTTKGELSFIVNEVNLGVAYEGIPLDKPLVPCVFLKYEGDSMEIGLSGVVENENNSTSIPSNIAAKRGLTWDSIDLAWDAVEEASFYQIETNGSKFFDASTANRFTKRGLLPDTEHTFRVRTVRENKVSEWSDAVKGKTQKAPNFSGCTWKECPRGVWKERKYSLGLFSPKIASKINGDEYYCTIIGNRPLPLNKVTSWSIKILKSRDNGENILVGVAPSDIDQNEGYNYEKCGWYFYCYYSTIHSGPPYNLRGKPYGPRKGYGDYVHTGDSVGVVMDTTKGELSFTLKETYLGVAYEGIPLDKPLVPCVILKYDGDSIEINIKRLDQEIITF